MKTWVAITALALGTTASSARMGPLITNTGAIVVNSDNEPVELTENKKATNPSWNELVTFLQTDPVNQGLYRPGKCVCTEFATALQRDAELAGWKCGFVSVKFTHGPGHALNIFQTTDRGRIYVDCTGGTEKRTSRSEFDTIGYIEVGQKYGRLGLKLAAADPTNYQYYVEVNQLYERLATEKRNLKKEGEEIESTQRRLEAARQETPPTEYNQWVAHYEQIAQKYNQKVEDYNRATQYEKGHYPPMRYPVKSVECWW